jgi:hypothetical protein
VINHYGFFKQRAKQRHYLLESKGNEVKACQSYSPWTGLSESQLFKCIEDGLDDYQLQKSSSGCSQGDQF